MELDIKNKNHSEVYEKAFGKKLHNDEARKRLYGIKDYLSSLEDTEQQEINNNESRVLVIPDLHAPFTKEGFLEFCIKMYNKYNCNQVVFLGDEVDNHYSSFHDTDPDGLSANDELDKAIDIIGKFYEAFPIAKVCYGNHSLIPNRKAFNAGLSKRWIRTIDEVLKVPNWDYKEEHIIDGVSYVHGTGRKARARAISSMYSVVQGHYHNESYVEFKVGTGSKRVFAMQLGSGIDREAYAFAYAKPFGECHLNVGIVIAGKLPIIEYFEEMC